MMGDWDFWASLRRDRSEWVLSNRCRHTGDGEAVYILDLGGGAYKFGRTSNLRNRLKQHRTTSPLARVLAICGTDKSLDIERSLLRWAKPMRISGEVFRLTDQQVEMAVEFLGKNGSLETDSYHPAIEERDRKACDERAAARAAYVAEREEKLASWEWVENDRNRLMDVDYGDPAQDIVGMGVEGSVRFIHIFELDGLARRWFEFRQKIGTGMCRNESMDVGYGETNLEAELVR